MSLAVLRLSLTHCSSALTFDTQQIKQMANSDEKKATAIFRFKNSGSSIVTIESILPGCECTTAELAKQHYAPDESGEIKVVFNFEGRVGWQEKLIRVTTDDPANKSIPLTLRVNITEPLTCSAHLLRWTVGEDFSEKSVTMESTTSLKITAIAAKPASPKDVTARVEPADIEGKFRLVLHPISATKVINVTVACVATFSDGTTYPFTVYALVR